MLRTSKEKRWLVSVTLRMGIIAEAIFGPRIATTISFHVSFLSTRASTPFTLSRTGNIDTGKKIFTFAGFKSF